MPTIAALISTQLQYGLPQNLLPASNLVLHTEIPESIPQECYSELMLFGILLCQEQILLNPDQSHYSFREGSKEGLSLKQSLLELEDTLIEKTQFVTLANKLTENMEPIHPVIKGLFCVTVSSAFRMLIARAFAPMMPATPLHFSNTPCLIGQLEDGRLVPLYDAMIDNLYDYGINGNETDNHIASAPLQAMLSYAESSKNCYEFLADQIIERGDLIDLQPNQNQVRETCSIVNQNLFMLNIRKMKSPGHEELQWITFQENIWQAVQRNLTEALSPPDYSPPGLQTS